MKRDNIIAFLLLVMMVVTVGSVSWIVTCGIVKLITLCFGLTFKWSLATVIWLVLILLSTTLKTEQ